MKIFLLNLLIFVVTKDVNKCKNDKYEISLCIVFNVRV